MPCRDYQAEEQDRRETVSNLHERTRMLCGLITELEKSSLDRLTVARFIEKVPGLTIWWEQHKAHDAARLKKEQESRRLHIAAHKAKIAELQREVEFFERKDNA